VTGQPFTLTRGTTRHPRDQLLRATRRALTLYQFWSNFQLSIDFGHFPARYILICDTKTDRKWS
jgi:hypothetical protein